MQIRTAIEQSDDNSVIHIIGSITLNDAISLTKRLSFTTNDEDKGCIKGKKFERNAFVNSKNDVSLRVTNLRFHRIGLLALFYRRKSTGISLSIENIHVFDSEFVIKAHSTYGWAFIGDISVSQSSFTNTVGPGITLQFSNEEAPLTINVIDSIFRSSQALYVFKVRKINVVNCSFNGPRRAIYISIMLTALLSNHHNSATVFIILGLFL